MSSSLFLFRKLPKMKKQLLCNGNTEERIKDDNACIGVDKEGVSKNHEKYSVFNKFVKILDNYL